MTRTKRSTLTLAAILLKALSLIVATWNPEAACLAASSPQWPTATFYGQPRWQDDFDEASKQARELGLPLVIHFGATWCRPCLQMERETLGTPEFTARLGRQVVGLKVDWDRQPDLIQKFGIKAVPCDIVMSPDGMISERHQKPQKRHEYFAMADRASRRFRQQREDALARLRRRTDRALETETRERSELLVDDSGQQTRLPDTGSPRNTDDSESGMTDRARRSSTVLASPDDNASAAIPDPHRSKPSERPATAILGLDGYCPVSIMGGRQWVKGKPQHSATWRGVVYRMASEAHLQRFRAAPHEYAPRMLGCDPVVLLESGRAIAGHVEFCAIYNGDLFLFANLTSLNRFKVNPDHYVTIRNAIRAGFEVPKR